MPSYFPEGNLPLVTDSIERSMAKAVSLFPSALDTLMVDPDVAAYVALSGATDVANLDAFVKGVKALELWESMVCWPLRSSQNAGTGTTAYSLGGLGTFDGTLVNGPTWGADGIAIGATQHINLLHTFIFPTNAATFFCAHKVTSTSAANRTLSLGIGPAFGFWAPFSDGNAYADFGNTTTARTSGAMGASNNTWMTYHAKSSGGAVSHYKDSTLISSGGTSVAANTYSDTTRNHIGGNNGVNAFGGTVAICAIFTKEASESFRDLYKQTLGTGLGLP